MYLPQPVSGLVLRYCYLWNREFRTGREEGLKDRPCLVFSVYPGKLGEKRVILLPITHTLPQDLSLAVEIPTKIKQHLRLDAERSWVIISEWNEFIWPGPDIRLMLSGSYGMVSRKFFLQVYELVKINIQTSKISRIYSIP